MTNGIQSTNTATVSMYAMELLNIQNSVDEYYYKYDKYPAYTNILLNVSDIELGDLYQFEDETIEDETISFKSIDFNLIGINDLRYGTSNQTRDIYVLSENTGKVYYLLGVEYNGKIHYTLTEEMYNLAGIQPTKLVGAKEIKKFDVIFVPSDVNDTNIPITVKVKLPKEATINSVVVTNEKSVGEETIEGVYKVISINDSSVDKNGNYEIQVSYTYNAINKTVKYQVDNFDNTSPIISVDETKEGKTRIINIQTKDEQNDIKVLKYAESIIKDAAYFKNYGKLFNGTQLRLNDDLDYTLYVEDSSGNYQIVSSKKYAIYSETDNSLTFLRTAENVVEGEMYEEQKVTKLYTGFEEKTYTNETDVPWYNYRTNITSVTVIDKIEPVDTSYWFYEFNNCTNLELTKLDTKNVIDMQSMFYYTGSEVQSFNIIGLDNWDTSKVKNMKNMFFYAGNKAKAFNIGNLGKWNTSSVTTMEQMFAGSGQSAETFDIGNVGNWQTSKVSGYGMYGMFTNAGNKAKTFNIGRLDYWDTSKITNMGYMFSSTGSTDVDFSIGDLSKWNTSNVKAMNSMFLLCRKKCD